MTRLLRPRAGTVESPGTKAEAVNAARQIERPMVLLVDDAETRAGMLGFSPITPPQPARTRWSAAQRTDFRSGRVECPGLGGELRQRPVQESLVQGDLLVFITL